MSKLYFECKKGIVTSELAQQNSDGTNKCPLFWSISEQYEISQRYRPMFGEYSTIVNENEILVVPMKTGIYKSSLSPVLTLRFYANTTVAEDFIFYYSFGDDVFQKTISTNVTSTLNFILPENTSRFEIINKQDNYLYVFDDYSVTFTSADIDNINSEFTNFSINPMLINSKTIDNKIRQRKIGKTQIEYTFELAITQEENKTIDDIRDFARLNKLLMNVYINYQEKAGNTVADFPQESGFLKYYYKNHYTHQKSGLYEYINLVLHNDTSNPLR